MNAIPLSRNHVAGVRFGAADQAVQVVFQADADSALRIAGDLLGSRPVGADVVALNDRAERADEKDIEQPVAGDDVSLRFAAADHIAGALRTGS